MAPRVHGECVRIRRPRALGEPAKAQAHHSCGLMEATGQTSVVPHSIDKEAGLSHPAGERRRRKPAPPGGQRVQGARTPSQEPPTLEARGGVESLSSVTGPLRPAEKKVIPVIKPSQFALMLIAVRGAHVCAQRS